MARTADDISQAIRAQLAVLDPDINAAPLTPERKIIDTVAEVIADSEVDQFVLNYTYDIDTKVGADLDKMVALFGFARQGGRAATGYVTLARTSVATTDIVIPGGTQVLKPASTVSPAVTFTTTASATIYTGTTSVTIPIECTISGPIGNVPAASITTLGSSSADISVIANDNATTGGTAEETDAELRVRFKNTIFRNVAGTQDQYLALAIASRFSNKANVIGPISRFIEYLQIIGGSATSQIPYSKYTYGFDYYLTDGAMVNETFYSPRGVDYTFNATVPPSLTVNNAVNLPNNTIVLLEHSYCSANSRNNPASNIANYVDVFVSGQDVTSVTEAANYPASANNFNTTGGSPFNLNNFRRDGTNALPVAGNRFQELLWQPVATLPGAITVGATTYTLGTHYWLVKDISAYKGSRRARNGIEWASSVSAIPGTAFTMTYTFDKLPVTLNELMDAHKQVTSDVLVHAATLRYLNVYLTVMYSPGYASATVDQAIDVALSDFLEKQQFGAVIQISDILEIAHEVPGVDNVRITGITESLTYGIQEVGSDGITLIGAPYTTDFALQDSDLPVLNAVVTLKRSQNTWGA
jgi:uncharacterized phage protein gp47/JayE